MENGGNFAKVSVILGKIGLSVMGGFSLEFEECNRVTSRLARADAAGETRFCGEIGPGVDESSPFELIHTRTLASLSNGASRVELRRIRSPSHARYPPITGV